jgi:hypothetical protein
MNRLQTTRIVFALTIIAVAIPGLAGCGVKDWKPSEMFSLDNTWPWRDDDEPAEGVPVRMVGAWTDTVLTRPGKNPERGFGGRVLFYGAKEKNPILVNGQLVVYAFDESGRDPTNNKPTRRYVFPAEQLPLHMSKSDMGASYSFWLPWDECGGPKTEVSLVCRFEPKGGAVITGEQTRHLLPGAITINPTSPTQAPPLPEGVPSQPAQTTLENMRARQQIASGAQLASYNAAAASPASIQSIPAEAMTPAPARQMSVSTISLPESFKVRHAAGAAVPVTTPSPTQIPAPAPVIPDAQAQPINPANATIRPRTALATPPAQTTNAFGAWPIMRPQTVSPQLVTSGVGQPASVPSATWNVTAVGHATMPQQQMVQQAAYRQPALMQQPVAQPMPAAGPVTTTVSYPSQPALPVPMGQPASFHSAPGALQVPGR